jgi:hypothetical protein
MILDDVSRNPIKRSGDLLGHAMLPLNPEIRLITRMNDVTAVPALQPVAIAQDFPAVQGWPEG